MTRGWYGSYPSGFAYDLNDGCAAGKKVVQGSHQERPHSPLFHHEDQPKDHSVPHQGDYRWCPKSGHRRLQSPPTSMVVTRSDPPQTSMKPKERPMGLGTSSPAAAPGPRPSSSSPSSSRDKDGITIVFKPRIIAFQNSPGSGMDGDIGSSLISIPP